MKSIGSKKGLETPLSLYYKKWLDKSNDKLIYPESKSRKAET